MSKLLDNFRVCGPNDKGPKDGDIVLNVTSTGEKNFWRQFSPMLLGPVKMWGPYGAFNVENAWQFSKVYEDDVDPDTNEPAEWWDAWAQAGWADSRAHRYPAGKGRRPLYSFWDGQKLGYIEARKQIYVPLYTQAVMAKKKELEFAAEFILDALLGGIRVWLWDFDGYDHKAKKMSFEDVLNNEKKKMGHAFVLHYLIEEILKNETLQNQNQSEDSTTGKKHGGRVPNCK